jgi:hypothetical protein
MAEDRKRRRNHRLVHYGVPGIVYGVSGPSHMPTLNPDQFGENHDELTSSTAEVSSGDGGDGGGGD